MTLSQLRKRIDRTDGELLRLLNHRALTAVAIGRLKKRQGLPVVDERREKAVLERITQATRGPLSPAALRRIFREILRESRKIQLSAGAGARRRGR